VLGILSLVLIAADYKTNLTGSTRVALSYVSIPFYWLANSPSNVVQGVDSYFTSRETLMADNERLHSEARILHGKLQKFISLTAENVRLRELLSSSTVLQDSVLIAELVNVSADPLKQQIVVNKGADEGVYVGQPAIDAYGLMGQVVEVNAQQARVILISDSRHSIPVQINRNGVRAIAEGAGRIDTLMLPNVVATTDIKAGDLLVSSGLGQRFPVGYPVGVVESVIQDPGKPFLKVVARPSAQLDRSRFVLLVFSGERTR
jgi:rod shape-determining protein MreC